jgi:hypothetical protein
MIGKKNPQASLYDVGNVFSLKLSEGSFYGQLAGAADRLFRDEDFAAFYCADNGRPSVPPSQLALLLVLQAKDGVSDAEAIESSAYDLRWCAVLRRSAGEPLCAKSTLQLFRAHLVLHDAAKAIFQESVREARRVGLLKGEAMRVALDTKPIEGRGAVEDTYNLLSTGIGLLADALAKKAGKSKPSWLTELGLSRYTEKSVKGSVQIDWSDTAAKEGFLTQIVADAKKMLALAEGQGSQVKEAADLLEKLLLQDVEEGDDGNGETTAQIKKGTAKGRMPSATDPEVRHGRKSKAKRFTGHKASVATEVESGIIVALDVLPGDSADSTGALLMTEQAEVNTGLAVEQTLGDCAYGSGETRQEFTDAERVLVAKVSRENRNNGLFPKSAFTIHRNERTATCPGGHTTEMADDHTKGGRTYYFDEYCGGCPLRARCTASALGRSLSEHPQEELLDKARAYQATSEGKAVLRQRVIVENALGRLSHLGIGQALYRGRAMTRFQLSMASTVANLRRSWNWLQGQVSTSDRVGGIGGQQRGLCPA